MQTSEGFTQTDGAWGGRGEVEPQSPVENLHNGWDFRIKTSSEDWLQVVTLKIIFMTEVWAREHQECPFSKKRESKKTPNSCYFEEMRQVETNKQVEPKSCFRNKKNLN